MNKREARARVKELRILNFHRHSEWSEIILSKLINSKVFMSFDSYFIYYGNAEEVATKKLIDFLLSLGKNVYLPRTEEKIVAVKVTVNTTYTIGLFGILEPKGEAYDGRIDLAVIPMVGFDADCNRLGHGKGYYDAYLMNFEGAKLGLAFSYQLFDNIDVDVYDVPMDSVLTEEGYYARYLR